MLLIKNPIAQFFTLDGDPLDNGSVYIGTPGLNPETNPVAIYWDRDGLIPAAQPVKTSRGYISNNGTPARIYINDLDYSVNVRDKNGVLIYSSLSVTGETIGALSGTAGAGSIGYDNGTSGLTATNVQAAIDEVASAPKVNRSGDTMTGPLNVPAGATGTQVPQAQEVVGVTGGSVGAAKIPSGTTAQRPTPAIGHDRFNSTIGRKEYYNGSAWRTDGTFAAQTIATTSGTAIDFENIPAWAVRFEVVFTRVSLNGSDQILVQVGGASGYVTSGYSQSAERVVSIGTVDNINASGFAIHIAGGSWAASGSLVIYRPISGNDYASSHACRVAENTVSVGGGVVAMTEPLTRIRITRSGSNAFDAGSVTLYWS